MPQNQRKSAARPWPPAGLVIFDCDGVLVDSEPLSMKVLLETAADAGAVIGAAEGYDSFLGRSLASVVEILHRDYSVAVGEPALDAMRERLYSLFRAELQPVAGVAAVLEHLALPFCVASSSQMERIALSLQVTKLAPFFGERIFSASMVRHGKPAPDLFLHAAGQMRAEPSRCIVVEDSPAGIAAAKRAGMRVFAFAGGSHAQGPDYRRALDLLEPTLIFDDMAALPELIARQESR